MLERVIKKTPHGTWCWFVRSASMLADWSDDLEAVRQHHLVKKNPVRWVGLVSDRSGQQYYVKIQRYQGLLGWLKKSLFPKGRAEFMSAQMVSSAGVSCAEYVGWGRASFHSGVFSRALGNHVSLRWAWKVLAHKNASHREKLLQGYMQLAAKMVAHNLLHPDFHSMNLLVEKDTLELTMIDPYGVKRCRLDNGQKSRLSMMPCMFMFADHYSWEELTQKMVRENFVGTQEQAWQLMRESKRRQQRRGARSSTKRRRQLMTGTSKYAVCEHSGEGRRMVRKNLSHEEQPLPAKMVCREMISTEAEKIWLESFFGAAADLRRRLPPVAFEQDADGSARLYFVVDPDDAIVYGFSPDATSQVSAWFSGDQVETI